jgi:hypothetical protein
MIVIAIEESLEMLGIVVFIHALMSYIKIYLGGVSWNIYIEGKKHKLPRLPISAYLPFANQQTETYQGKSLETGFDARKEYCIRAFNQDKNAVSLVLMRARLRCCDFRRTKRLID